MASGNTDSHDPSLGRTIYHTGLHAGQIALIRKHAPQPAAAVKQELIQ